MEENLTNIYNSSEIIVNVKVGLVELVPDWCRRMLIVFLSIVFLTGLPGNIIVIAVQSKIKRKTATDWFVTFIALCDVMSLAVNVPVYVTITKKWWPNIGSTSGCRFHNFVLHLTNIASTFLISLVGLDRLLKTKHLGPQLTANKAVITSIVAFGMSMILGIVAAFCTRNNILGHCIYDPSREILQLVLYLMVISITTLCGFIILYSYTRVFIILKSRMKITPMSDTLHSARSSYTLPAPVFENHYSKAVRTTKLMFLVTIVFIASTIIPNLSVIALTSTDYRNNGDVRVAMFFFTRLYLFNNCTNPYFYIWLNNSFRKRTFAIFKNLNLLC